MGDAGDAGGWIVPDEPLDQPVETSHTLVVEHSGDPAVDLNSGVVHLPGVSEGAILPKPVRVEQAEDTGDAGDDEARRGVV